MKKIGYYPGCSLEGSSQEYGKSIEKLYEILEIELQEIDDWVCCGASPGHSSSHILPDALALENLSLAKKQGIDKLMVPCMACYSRFKFCQHNMRDPELKDKLESIVCEGEKYENDIDAVHLLDNLNETEILNKIKKNLKKKLKDLKAVCYYGCMFTRPPEVTGVENFEDPDAMERLLEIMGVDALDWNYKTKCCGGALSISNTDVALDLSYKVLSDAKDAGADVIVVACPLCQVNLDLRQGQIEKRHNMKFSIPILYVTQLIGLSVGCTSDELGLDKHFVNPDGVL